MDVKKDRDSHCEHDEQLKPDLAVAKEGVNDDVSGPPVMDGEWHSTSKRLVRKLDMTLMPIIWALYLFNYLDRTSIA